MRASCAGGQRICTYLDPLRVFSSIYRSHTQEPKTAIETSEDLHLSNTLWTIALTPTT